MSACASGVAAGPSAAFMPGGGWVGAVVVAAGAEAATSAALAAFAALAATKGVQLLVSCNEAHRLSSNM